MNRAELHFHLLPGVDDGPEDMAESVELARRAAFASEESGVKVRDWAIANCGFDLATAGPIATVVAPPVTTTSTSAPATTAG